MKLPWSVAAVAIACIAAIVGLAVMHADSTSMLAVLMSIVGGLSVATHQQTNGNTSRLIDLVERQSAELSRTMPAKPDQPDAPTGGTTP